MWLRLGFHLLMLVVLVLAVAGGFSLLKTASTMRHHGATLFPVIGVVVIWLLGGFVLWVSRGSPGTD